MKVKSILKQNQLDRDMELSEITGVSLTDVEKWKIGDPAGIRIFEGKDQPSTEVDMTNLYRNLLWLNQISYFKTLMFTSIYRRGSDLIPFLIRQKGKICLDYGCGVGSHTIILRENSNAVTPVEVDGPMMEFAQSRFQIRSMPRKVESINFPFVDSTFDVALCIEVLEHVFDPLSVLKKMHAAMKVEGHLFLRYSDMIKSSSGHFASNIAKIRKQCVPFLQKHFKMAGKSVYVKL
jgi:2-polyprenyl-3-methyl-5-hydroxy-6-metoxy-1,4-benzoquinol methylase